MKVWVNGVFHDDKDANISVFDAGIQHGVGLFETVHARNGVVFRGKQHMDRLAESATLLRLTEQLQIDPLVEALQLCVTENNQDSARLRLTLTGGNLNMLQKTGSGVKDPTIIIQSQPPTEYPAALFEKGVVVSLASGRGNPYDLMAGHKTLNYWSRLLNLQLSAAQKCGEALWLSQSAHIVGGSVSNVFLVKNNTLITPVARGEETAKDVPSAVLPGITRDVVLSLASDMGMAIDRCNSTLDEFLDADEAFLTNSSWGVLPVVGVTATVQDQGKATSELQQVGSGSVGAQTNTLRRKYWELVETETSG